MGAIALSCCACVSARSVSADRSEVIARFDQYHSIFISHDFALLERLATSDLLHVTASGHVNTLQDLEKSLSDPAVKLENIYSDNHQVRFSGDTAVVVARIHATGARDGKPIDNVWRVSAIFLRRDGEWRVQSTHACVLKDRNEK